MTSWLCDAVLGMMPRVCFVLYHHESTLGRIFFKNRPRGTSAPYFVQHRTFTLLKHRAERMRPHKQRKAQAHKRLRNAELRARHAANRSSLDLRLRSLGGRASRPLLQLRGQRPDPALARGKAPLLKRGRRDAIVPPLIGAPHSRVRGRTRRRRVSRGGGIRCTRRSPPFPCRPGGGSAGQVRAGAAARARSGPRSR
jgi:hypothetical protein